MEVHHAWGHGDDGLSALFRRVAVRRAIERDRRDYWRTAHELLDCATDAGINFFDTANRYGVPPGTSERHLGEWLAERDRDKFGVATKVGLPVSDGVDESGLPRRHVRQQIEVSLV